MKMIITLILICGILLINNVKSVNLDGDVILNTTSSNSSMDFGILVTADMLEVKSDSVNLYNVSYIDSSLEGSFNLTTTITWNKTNSHINSTSFPYYSFSNLSIKNISSSLNQAVDGNVTFNVSSCSQLLNMSYTSYTGDYNVDYLSSDNWTCLNSKATINIIGIENSSSANQLEIFYDTSFPTIRGIDSPENNTYYTNSDIDINLTSEDDVEIDTTWANIKYTNGTNIVSNFTINSSCGSFICGTNYSLYSFPVILNEDQKLNIYVNDTSGNEVGEQVNLSVGLDTSVPTITITEPSGTETSYTISIEFSVTDNVAVSTCEWNITLAGVISNKSGIITNCTVDETLTLNLQSEATYIFNLQANDTSGNWNSDSSSFIIDLPEGVVSPGGGGGGPELKKAGEFCAVNEECLSQICDLEENRKGEHSETYQTCVLSLCGNNFCSKDESFISCRKDCGIVGEEAFTPFVKYAGFFSLLIFGYFLAEKQIKKRIKKIK